MGLMINVEPIPIVIDTEGVARIGQTRVTLQAVIAAFNRGASPEEIIEQYPTVPLSEIYLVVGYYLQHRHEVDAYIQQQKAEHANLRH